MFTKTEAVANLLISKEDIQVDISLNALKSAVSNYKSSALKAAPNNRQATIYFYAEIKKAKTRLFLAESERMRKVMGYGDNYCAYSLDEQGRAVLNADYELPTIFHKH